MGTKDARIPVATYRVQLNKNFTFRDARLLAKYLSKLGISDYYISPILKAKSGSLHCYDAVDHSRLNPELGAEKEFDTFVLELKHRRMGLLLDIVPNHMSTSDENRMWKSVLEYGIQSPYAPYFDIDWSKRGNPKGKLFLPILCEPINTIVSAGKLKVGFDTKTAEFFLGLYGGHKFPLTPRSYWRVLGLSAKVCESDSDNIFAAIRQSLITSSERLFQLDGFTHDLTSYQLAEKVKRELLAAFHKYPVLTKSIRESIHSFNERARNYSSGEFGSLLNDQFYVLGHWRDDACKINYRRFFEVNDLAAVRVEDDRVFVETHRLIFKLLSHGKVTGLRVDHPDGLLDPTMYFRRLQTEYSKLQDTKRRVAFRNPALYVLAEKILTGDEPLKERWEIYGSTGYDFANDLTRLFVYPSSSEFEQIYNDFIHEKTTFEETMQEGKRIVLHTLMQSEWSRLSDLLYSIARQTKAYSHLELEAISRALEEVVVHFPVYRTYITQQTRKISENEFGYINKALNDAAVDQVERGALKLIRKLLLLQKQNDLSFKDARTFVLRFQQFTGPVMAKGVEDTALYRYNLLSSLNEVGGEPSKFDMPIDAFHSRNINRAARWPHTMLASSTHDTKRSEDIRARINVLSEMPEEWHSWLVRCSRINNPQKSLVDGRLAPSRNDEYLIYQTLLGSWPLGKLEGLAYHEYVDRVLSYARKASKEEKQETSWLYPNVNYDLALDKFVRRILEQRKNNKFLKELQRFGKKIHYFGMLNSLSQLLLKLTSPGVPDIYQGNEVWDFSLVDPDNRRKVDFDHIETMHRNLLVGLRKYRRNLGELSSRLLNDWEDGLVKMLVLHLTLTYRSNHVELFRNGDYLPIRSDGSKQDHICAFLRKYHNEKCLVIAPRFYTKLAAKQELPFRNQVWTDTRILLPDGMFQTEACNLFTGERLRVQAHGRQTFLLAHQVFSRFPIALLTEPQTETCLARNGASRTQRLPF